MTQTPGLTKHSVPRYSLLDLSPIVEGSTPTESFRNSLDLARHAERLGYTRYWVAEHHAMPGIASAATSVVIGYIAAGTSTIRVGAGGIMLPNHAPLIIAEQFGTLEAMYPGRIDLGLGRAPGTDQHTVRALRRDPMRTGDTFPTDLAELRSYFAPALRGQKVVAVPGAGMNIPIWLLGSSDFSARLAAELGLPFAFASHFAPEYLHHSLQLYRENFRPSATLSEPYAMAGINIFAADTDAEGERLASSMQQQFLNLIRQTPGQLSPPINNIEEHATPAEMVLIKRMLRYSAIGSLDSVRDQLASFIEATQVDELMMTSHVYDHQARIRSLEIAAAAMQALTG